MIDSLKTLGNATIGVGVWWVNLPMILQMMVSVLTIAYIAIKIKKELKNG
jgi:hypothetical protein